MQNQLFAPIAFLLGLHVHFLHAIEVWREESGQHVGEWLLSAGEFEALLSLSGYHFEHPGDAFPEVTIGPAAFEGEGMAHPLLPAKFAVRNDFSIGGEKRLVIVSGSNMSGKSTLLRTIGINLVLALAGAPVRAKRLKTAPLQIGTAMRVHDSLQQGMSLFFAVITRLKQLVDLSRGPQTLLFLVDEILQGTNSRDRRIGAEGVIRRLVENGAMGLVTTHDLALTEIVASFDGRAANIHFEDHLEEGRMTFDYRIRPGVVERSNALELMRLMGLGDA
jgi:DNA mismatch repair ATPase MutS